MHIGFGIVCGFVSSVDDRRVLPLRDSSDKLGDDTGDDQQRVLECTDLADEDRHGLRIDFTATTLHSGYWLFPYVYI